MTQGVSTEDDPAGKFADPSARPADESDLPPDPRLEAPLCAQLQEAKPVPYQVVVIGDWRPSVGCGHSNVEIWVRANPYCRAVRGWVFDLSRQDNLRLTGHSIVEGVDGRLFDITPLENERRRTGMRFLAHDGDDKSFFILNTQWEPCNLIRVQAILSNEEPKNGGCTCLRTAARHWQRGAGFLSLARER
jgi:hypothetical protein